MDPLVSRIVAMMWVFKELVGQWKTGRRLSFEEKTLLVRYLLVQLHEHQARCNQSYTHILIPFIHTLAQEQIRCNAFDHTGHSVPHGIDEHDITLCEAPYEEEYDTDISDETAKQIANLVMSCKELQLKVAYNFGEAQSQ